MILAAALDGLPVVVLLLLGCLAALWFGVSLAASRIAWRRADNARQSSAKRVYFFLALVCVVALVAIVAFDPTREEIARSMLFLVGGAVILSIPVGLIFALIRGIRDR